MNRDIIPKLAPSPFPSPLWGEGRVRGIFENTAIHIALIVFLGLIVYANSLNGEFLWDDEHLIENNSFIRDWRFIPKIFVSDIGDGAGKEYEIYRPILILTLMFDYFIWGLKVQGYHLSTIIFHILASLMLFWLINILFNNKLLSFFTSILFVAHPIHTEDVAYITGRSDSLALCFMLLSFICYIKYLNTLRLGTFLFMISFYILALLSKENSIVVPILILVYNYTFKKGLHIKSFFAMLAITLIFILLRHIILKPPMAGILFFSDIPTRFTGFFIALFTYIRLLILPFNLHMEYGFGLEEFSISNPKVFIGIFIFVSTWVFAARKRHTDSLSFFSVAWFFVMLLPMSNIFYPASDYMAERYMYVPSIGFFMVAANLFVKLHENKRIKHAGLALLGLVLVFYSRLTIKQNNYWKTPITFYERTLQYAPKSFRIYYNLGNTYLSYGKTEEAITCYKKAIELNPYDMDSYYNLGNIYFYFKKIDDAIVCYKKSIEFGLINDDAYNNLAVLYANTNKKEAAIPFFEKAIETSPKNGARYYNLSMTYFDIKKYEEAIKYCDMALKLGYSVPEDFLEEIKPYRK